MFTNTRSTQENQAQSPLRRLPTELHNTIYKLAFLSTSVKVHPKWNDPRWYHESEEPRGILTLLQTCRQINAKTMQFFLSNVTFDPQSFFIKGFITAFGHERLAFVTSIVVNIPDIWSKDRAGKMSGIAAALEALETLKHVHVLYSFDPYAEEEAY
jgi:hypothetical protein